MEIRQNINYSGFDHGLKKGLVLILFCEFLADARFESPCSKHFFMEMRLASKDVLIDIDTTVLEI